MVKNDAILRLEKLLSEGKISESEFEELKKAILADEPITEKGSSERLLMAEGVNLVKFKTSNSCDVKIVGREGNSIEIIEGKELFRIHRENGVAEIVSVERDDGTMSSAGILHFLENHFLKGKRVSVVVPQKINVEIGVVSGDIFVSGIQGNVSVKSISGDIRLENITGSANAVSISGDIALSKFDGSLHTEAKSGDIKLSYSKLSGTLKTYSGDVSVKGGEISADVTVYSGDISIQNVNINKYLSVKSNFGDVNLKIDKNDFRIEGETDLGEIYLNFKGNVYNVEDGELFAAEKDSPANFTREKLSHGSRVIFGSGSIPVKIKTKKGDISINII
jgi:DUF4097 and DUF4098 domain-containing protein YvlB